MVLTELLEYLRPRQVVSDRDSAFRQADFGLLLKVIKSWDSEYMPTWTRPLILRL